MGGRSFSLGAKRIRKYIEHSNAHGWYLGTEFFALQRVRFKNKNNSSSCQRFYFCSAEQATGGNVLQNVDCVITNNGNVSCVVPTQLSGLCMPNLKKYPFDVQNCTLRFGSWIHTGQEIDFELFNQSITVDQFTENPEWILVSSRAKKNSGVYKCCPKTTFPSIDYNFVIKRDATTVTAVAIIPALRRCKNNFRHTLYLLFNFYF